LNLAAGLGVTVKVKVSLECGFADYLLFVNRKAVGVVGAQEHFEG
jgi:hypothetical protein